MSLPGYFWARYRSRTIGIVGLLWFAAVLDVLSLAVLLPLLHTLTSGGSEAGVTRWLAEAVRGFAVEPSLAVLLVIIIALLLGKALVRWVAMRQVGNAVVNVAHELRTQLQEALLAADWRFFVQTPAGHLSSAAGAEAYRAAFAYRRLCSVLTALLQLVFTVGLVVLVSPWAGLLALVLGGVLAVVLRGVVGASRQAGLEQSAALRELSARVTDTAHTMKPARGMARESGLTRWLLAASEALRRSEVRQLRASDRLYALHEPLAALALAGTLLGTHALTGQSPAALLVLGLLFYRVLQQVNVVQLEYQGYVWGEAAFRSVLSQIDQAARLREQPPSTEPVRKPATAAFSHTLEFANVSFAFEREPVISQFNLRVPFGAIVCIRGPSGVGKTTLLDLVAGLYRPDSGDILIDGVPLAHINLHGWRSKLGYVTQEPALLHASVRDNLTLGEAIPDAPLHAALARARALDFVTALPRGLDTVVGEHGYRLSGGQRQRLALARALVHGPRLLLLDEPTSNVDPETQDAILASLKELRGSHTILAAAHHQAVQQVADLIVDLGSGRDAAPVPRVYRVAAGGLDG